MEDLTKTQIDTARANSRTFQRRDFQSPPRERIEDKAAERARMNRAAMPTISDDHFIDEIPRFSSGGGLPAGYVETDIILCVNGSPVNGKILFKEDE